MKKALSILLSIIIVIALLPINYLASTVADNYASIVMEAYNLPAGRYLNGGYSYTLAGEIVSIDTPYSKPYNNITVTIVVNDMTDKPVQLFRLRGDGADKLEVGNTVIAKGPIVKYAFKDDEGNVTATRVEMEHPTLLAHNGTGVDDEDVVTEFKVITTPEVGKAYKFFMTQNNIGKLLYLKSTTHNNGGKFIESTTKAKEAVDVYVEQVSEGYKFYTIIDNVKKYLLAKTESSIGEDGREKISKFVNWEATGSVFYYNTTAKAWLTEVNGKEYVIGTYGNYETASLSDASYVTAESTRESQFPIQLVEKAAAENAAEIKPEEPEVIVPTAGTVWTYKSDIKAWTTTIDGTEYFVGSYSTFDTLSLTQTVYINADNTGVTQFPMVIVDKMTNDSIIAPEENMAYRAYMNQVISGNQVYALGVATNDQNKYIDITETADEAVDVYAEKSGSGYKFYILNGTNKAYLTARLEGQSKFISWSGTTTTPETPDNPVTPPAPPTVEDPAADSTLTIAEAIALGASKEHNTYTSDKYYVEGKIKEVYQTTYGNMRIEDANGNVLTLYGTWSADGKTRYDELATKPVAGDTVKVYGIIGQYQGTAQMKNGWIVTYIPVGGTTPIPVPTPNYAVIEAPVAGTAYKFGMIQQNVSATDVYYIDGVMISFYMNTTTDASAAVDVYLEETTGGYYLYAMVGGAKKYINMVVNGTHVDGAYEDTASTVYTYDAESKTIVATVNEVLYWFGTRNDRPYTTVGPVKTENNAFYLQFYGVDDSTTGGTTPCVHSYDNECDEDCNVCGEIRMAPHNFGEWQIISEANCSHTGEKQRVCLNDATHVETAQIGIVANGHNFGEWQVIREADCSHAGEKQRVCLNDATHVETSLIDIVADGHNFGEWQESVPGTCTTASIECRICLNNSNHKETREGEIDPHNHNFSDWVENLPGNCQTPTIEARICFNNIEHSETREGAILTDMHIYDDCCDDECNLCNHKRKPPHAYNDEGICVYCNHSIYVLGDVNGDSVVTDQDALYLLFYTFAPEEYPIYINCDFDNNGVINDRDAVYLLYYTFDPENYPIN